MDNLPAVKTDAAALMEVISRSSSDPAVDPDKLSKLLDMYERIDAKRAEREYADAMNVTQSKMRPVSQDASNPQTRSKYASYAALDNALRPIYSADGFALSFDTADGAPESYVRVVCEVSHKGGCFKRRHLDMPADGKGAKGGDVMTKTHATMSAISYARRGLLKMVFNIAEGEFDDDGNGAWRVSAGHLTPEQAAQLRKMLADANLPEGPVLTWAKVEKLEDILAENFGRVVAAIQGKINAKKVPQ